MKNAKLTFKKALQKHMETSTKEVIMHLSSEKKLHSKERALNSNRQEMFRYM